MTENKSLSRLELFTKESDIVPDLFLGSGTTAVAASLHGRKYIGIELKKEYFDDAKKNVAEVKKVLGRKNHADSEPKTTKSK